MNCRIEQNLLREMDMKSSDASCISKRAQTKTISASESTEELVHPRTHVRVCVQKWVTAVIARVGQSPEFSLHL